MTTPGLSVVIASWGSETLLNQCLASLAAQRDDAEVIVASALPADTLARVQQEYPWVRIEGVPEASVFVLRARGASQARGALIAILEDHVTVVPRWAQALRAAHAAGHGILGGPVDNGLTCSAVDWALYFVEYGLHMPPTSEGLVPAVSGVNVAYDAALLHDCRAIWTTEFHENEVNDALAARHGPPWMVPDAQVATHLPMSLVGAMRHLFDGGRQYAGYRVQPMTTISRAMRIVATPLVPLVLHARIARRVLQRQPGRRWWLLRSAAATLTMLVAWATGELAGYAWPADGSS